MNNFRLFIFNQVFTHTEYVQIATKSEIVAKNQLKTPRFHQKCKASATKLLPQQTSIILFYVEKGNISYIFSDRACVYFSVGRSLLANIFSSSFNKNQIFIFCLFVLHVATFQETFHDTCVLGCLLWRLTEIKAKLNLRSLPH